MPGRQPDRPRAWTTRMPLFPLLLSVLAAAVAALAVAGDARADLVFLKDGSVLQGKVSREGKTVIDGPSGQPVWMPQGFFWIDDGARRIAFSPGQVQPDGVEERAYNPEHDIIATRVSAGQRFLPPLREIVAVGSWDERWDRHIKVRCEVKDNIGNPVSRDIKIIQHLTMLTPHFARFDALGFDYRWTACQLTRELGPDMVRSLIAAHPDFKETNKMDENARVAKRFRAFHFLVQAGWYDHAEKELQDIRRTFPGQSDKVETALGGLKRLRAQQLVDDLKRAHAAGQHRAAQQRLAEFREEGVPEKTLAEVRAIKDRYEKTTEALKQAQHFLDELPKAITDAAQRELFTAAARAIGEELDYDNAGRLHAFLVQAAQAERLRQKGKPVEHGPAQLMALAVTGWLLGNTSAEARPPVAERLWRARELALQYQRTDDAGERQRLLRRYLAAKEETVPVEEMAQLILSLPPPAPPEEKSSVEPTKLQSRPAGRGKTVAYHVKLPPEYHPGRLYPVLIVLHSGGVDGARDMLEHWSDMAARHGYILAAPDWGEGLKATYTYAAAEHAAVLDVLRDLRRRFNVDSDRVFLFGWREGGSMAYDVGLSHPDAFAGVLPMGGHPLRFAQAYRRNAQYLPFYVVSGDHSGPSHLANRRQFEDWIPKGYPAIFVECRGRGMEWFAGELPYLFDWMKHKKRVTPMSEAGAQGREFQTMRSTDNRFYWLSTDEVHPANLNEGTWSDRVLTATLWGHVDREVNQITVRTGGLRQLSVWMPRDSEGRGLVDFGAAVTVTINGQRKMSGKVTPSMETLLEDLYQRGDRQRLFLARLDFKP